MPRSKDTNKYIEFHEASSIAEPYRISPSKWPESWKRIYYKGYPRFERIKLSKTVWNQTEEYLVKTITRRRSNREYTPRANGVSKDEISFLLLGAAITKKEEDLSYESYRAYPSGGARYPLEVYIIILKSSDLNKGIYHYHVRNHSLEYLWPVTTSEVQKCFPSQSFLVRCSAIFVISSIMRRTTVKYKERGYRFALLEAGHLAQNICLLSQAKDKKHCPVGGFIDNELTRLLELDGEEELPLYALAVL